MKKDNVKKLAIKMATARAKKMAAQLRENIIAEMQGGAK